MSKLIKEITDLKKSMDTKRTSLEAAATKFNKLVASGKITKRGNNLPTLNDQILRNKHRYSL